jgi:hypothetical protein
MAFGSQKWKRELRRLGEGAEQDEHERQAGRAGWARICVAAREDPISLKAAGDVPKQSSPASSASPPPPVTASAIRAAIRASCASYL